MNNTTKYRLPIPLKISTNTIYAGIHWKERKAHKDAYKYHFRLFKNCIPKQKTPCHVYFDFRFRKNLLDVDNHSYMTKLLIDCLVDCQIIPDDSPKYVKGVTMTIGKSKAKDDYVDFYFL